MSPYIKSLKLLSLRLNSEHFETGIDTIKLESLGAKLLQIRPFCNLPPIGKLSNSKDIFLLFQINLDKVTKIIP